MKHLYSVDLNPHDRAELRRKLERVEPEEIAPGRWRKQVIYGGMVFLARYSECPDCGEPWPQCPQVKNWIWRHVGYDRKSVACLPCLQKRLGRELVVQDLNNPDAPINSPFVPSLQKMDDGDWESFVEQTLGPKGKP